MSALATATAPITLLVPVSVLPGEGDEQERESSWENPVTSTADLFRAYHELAIPRAVKFVITGNDVACSGDLESAGTLQLLHIAPDEYTSQPLIETRYAVTKFDWAGVVREVGQAMLAEHFLGTPDEVARVFSEAVRQAAVLTSRCFAGNPVPLLSIHKSAGQVTISFLGIWLADEYQVHEMRREIPARSWHDSDGEGESTCLLLDGVDVEGRGLKEMAISAAMLALVLGSTASAAEPLSSNTKTGASKLASFFSGGENRRGEKLPVKTQKLVQDEPRIYRDVLDVAHPDIRIIVNIGAQRAYIVKNGRIAFDTPISSASTGHRTPRGSFTITEKVRSGKMSTIYKCPLPGWMRLGETAVGMHQGDLPGYPASHGCIRMPLESALFIFDHVKVGTPVEVVDSWSPSSAAPQPALVAQAN